MKKISGVYKITNTATGDFYIGSSKDVKHRWACHKCPSILKKYPNNPLYLDMKKYGVDKFDFQILEEAEIDRLKEREQWFIENMKPTYNSNNANGWDVERYNEYQKSDKRKEYQKEYHKSDKYKEYHKEYFKKYNKSDKCKEYHKSDKYKEYHKEYDNQLCYYNNETLTLAALSSRFRRAEIEHPAIEAKKYLLKKESKSPIEFYSIYP